VSGAPSPPVLLYDGHCRFCIAQASRLARWVRGRIELVSFRDPGVLERHPGLTIEACEQGMQLVLPDGRIASGAEAAARALQLRRLLAPLGWLYFLPGLRVLADAGYRVLARNRFRLGGAACNEEACGRHQAREPPGRGHVAVLFLRLLGTVHAYAFGSLFVQVDVLWGQRGLLPACAPRAISGPSLLQLSCSDAALKAITLIGALLGVALTLGAAPRWCLVATWGLYLSLVSVGQTFTFFQWDNLLLETTFLALFIAPGGRRLRATVPPRLGVFLMQWLLFRLHVESGAAKLLLRDPGWRDLTAMVSYYETAPLPTWIGWWAHQLPVWAHRLAGAATYAVELGLPFLIWGPRRVRLLVFAAMAGLQVVILLTANYGIFNYLSLALCCFVLDDGHLGRATLPAPPPRGRLRVAAWTVLAALLTAVSLVPFLPFLPPLRPAIARLGPLPQALRQLRTLNAYHLFAQMTYVRREAVIEGSADGTTWAAYEFRYKPGDPHRRPPFVAPHQPRVDFQLWFLLLHGPRTAPYFETLLARLLAEPEAVAPLFAHDPFPSAPPRWLRVAYYRYRFTDFATRRATGAWWRRDLEGYSRPRSAGASP
jgi:predicted DCC family thiol-disulfide oxidoreductase YuxK